MTGSCLVATAAPWDGCPGSPRPFLLFLLFRVTGIPATEAQALPSRADDERLRASSSPRIRRAGRRSEP